MRPTKPVDFEGITRHDNVNIMFYEPKEEYAGSIWRLVYSKIQQQDSAQKQLAHNKHRTIGRPLFLHQEDGCAL